MFRQALFLVPCHFSNDLENSLWVLQLMIRFPPLSAALKAAGSEGSEAVKVTDSDPPTLTVNQAPPQTEAGNHGNITTETAQPESCE